MKKLLSAALSAFAFSLALQASGQALSNINIITGSGFEIVGTSTGSTFDITTKPGGGSINISTRSTGSGIFIASSTNNVGMGGITNPQYTLDVSSGSAGFGDVVSGSFSTSVHGPVLTSGDGYIKIGDINSNGFPVIINSGSLYLDIGSSFAFSGGPASFDSAITIGYPSVATDAARKDYVDSNFAPIGGTSGVWRLTSSYLYPSSTSWNVGVGTTTPITKLSVYGAENANRISQGGASIPYTELAQRSWGGNNAIFFGAYATSTYVNGDFLTAGNTMHKYASSSFGAADHRAKALIGDHLGIGFYISGISPGADQNVTWNQEFYVSPSNVYIPTNNVGIGESAPGSKLSVSGNATIGANYDTVAGPSNGLAVEGGVGIGTTTPAVKLHVQDGNVRINNTTATSTIEIRGTSNSINPRLHLSEDGASGGTLMFDSTANTLNLMTGTSLETYSPRVVIARDSGNIGIATTTPQAQIHTWNNGDNDLIVEADADNTGEDDNPRVVLRQDGNLVNGIFGIMGSTAQYADPIANSTFIESKDNGGASALQFVTGGNSIGGTNGSARMTILSAGNVGIGTTTPSTKFHVVTGAGNAATFSAPITIGYPAVSTDAATKAYVDTVAGIAQSASWIQSGSNLYPSSTSWSVGIGNTSPAGKLDITHSFSQGTNSSLNFGARGITTASGSGIVSNLYGAYFETNLNTSAAGGAPTTANNYGIYAKASSTNYAHNNSGTTNYYGGYFEASGSTDGADTTKNYGIYVNAAGGDTNYSGVFMGGNLGVGTATPGYTLDVSGIARASTYFISPAFYVSGGATEVGNAAGGSPRLVLGASSITTTGTGDIGLTSGNLGVGTTSPGSYKLNVQAGSAQTLLESTSDAQLVLKSSDSWSGILFDDSGATDDYIWYNGGTGTFAVGGGGSGVSGKKVHVDGGMTIGVNYDPIVMATNGLSVEGSVAIGTSTPATKLHLFDSSSGPIMTMSGSTTVYRGITIKDIAGSEQWFYGPNTSNNFVIRRGGSTDELTVSSSGGVSSGSVFTLSSATPFSLTNTGTGTYNKTIVYADTSNGLMFDLARTTDSAGGTPINFSVNARGGGYNPLFIRGSNGYVGIGTTTPATALQVIGTITATKLNADEVDPPYTINGKKYATYMAGMTGLKEETSGVVKLKNGKAVLDLASANEGSDLWMFAQTINLSGKIYVSESGQLHETNSEEVLNNVIVLLTPSFDGRVWYEKKGGKIFINSSEKNGEISYRLTAPRFDAVKKDGNLRTGDDVEGLNLDKLLK